MHHQCERRDRTGGGWANRGGLGVATRRRMRSLPSCLLITSALGACGSSSKVSPDAAPDAAPDGAPDADTSTKIAITSDAPLLLAAFRDGASGPWQAATMKTATSYEIAVHG